VFDFVFLCLKSSILRDVNDGVEDDDDNRFEDADLGSCNASWSEMDAVEDGASGALRKNELTWLLFVGFFSVPS
jgi:hypothetical protein